MCQTVTNVKKRYRFQAMVVALLAVSSLPTCKSVDPYIRTVDSPYIQEKEYNPTGRSKQQIFEDNLDNSIGMLTYDRALITWGEPTSVVNGDEIFLATWGNEEADIVVLSTNKISWAFPIERGWKLQLYFNRATRKLFSWKYNKWGLSSPV